MIQDRLIELIKALGMTPNSFAAQLDMAQSNIHNIVSGRRNAPRWETLEKIFTAFPEVSAEWLARGIEPMFLDEEKQRAHEAALQLASSQNGTITQVTVTGRAKKIIGTGAGADNAALQGELAQVRAALGKCQEEKGEVERELRKKNDKIIELLEAKQIGTS